MNEKFYMVYAEGKQTPARKHLRLEDAEAEAKRISEKEGVNCYVMEMVSWVPKPEPIKWNAERRGVEVRAEGVEFFIPDMPNCYANWDDARDICKVFSGNLPTREQLKYISANITNINELLKVNNCRTIPISWIWSNEEASATDAWYVYMNNGYVLNYTKSNNNYVRAVSAL